MKKHILTSILYTAITAIALGIVYPLGLTVAARLLFPAQAKGELIVHGDQIVGSHLIGQPFTGDRYFHSRPSAAGTGYDASASSGSNLAPTSKALVARINTAAQADPDAPIDLVTTSGSGLDPDLSPAAAYYQTARIAKQRHLTPAAVNALIQTHTTPRQFGLLGEPRVNVLDLNLALDAAAVPPGL